MQRKVVENVGYLSPAAFILVNRAALEAASFSTCLAHIYWCESCAAFLTHVARCPPRLVRDRSVRRRLQTKGRYTPSVLNAQCRCDYVYDTVAYGAAAPIAGANASTPLLGAETVYVMQAW
jgi:hypothetical protein